VIVIAGAELDVTWIVLAGLFVTGANSATNFQSRYAATDLAEPLHVGRALSLVVWATTVGSVIGPNLTEPGARAAGALGIPDLAGPFDQHGAGSDADLRQTRDLLVSTVDETITRAFRPSFLFSAALAAAAFVLAALVRRREGT
jgi:hypothetical protein